MKTNRSNFIIIFFIILLFIIVGTWYLVRPSSKPPTMVEQLVLSPTTVDRTTNWKTYTFPHTDYQYSIQYPSNWTLKGTVDDTLLNFGAAHFQSPGKSFIFTRPKQIVNDYEFENLANQFKIPLMQTKESKIRIDDLDAIRIVGNANPESAIPEEKNAYMQAVFIRYNNKVYIIGSMQADDEDISETFEQMLTTFHFDR